MSPYFLISLAAQVALVVHCIKTGRNSLWIWALMLLPAAGPIAYVLVEILPAMFGSRTTRRAVRGLAKTLDPGQDLRRYETVARLTGDVASRQRYAEELTRQARYPEAISVYKQALNGLYESDPNLLLGLAHTQHEQGSYSESRATLDTLIERNPDFKSAAGHLLYARALEGEGNRDKALAEYAVLTRYFAGAEAPLRYALLLRSVGRMDDARGVLKELLDHAKLAPRHYRKMQQEWLGAAERELAIRNLDRESNLLRAVRAALHRIGEGNFGTCLHCEEDISSKRLNAVPWAAYCIGCQEIADRNREENNESFDDLLVHAA